MNGKSERRGPRDRRKPGSPSTGGRRKGLRRIQDRQKSLEAKMLQLRKDIEKLTGPKPAKRRGRGWGAARPDSLRKTFRREPVIKSGLKELPASKRRWMSLADKVRDVSSGRRIRRGLR